MDIVIRIKAVLISIWELGHVVFLVTVSKLSIGYYDTEKHIFSIIHNNTLLTTKGCCV